jgi:hypothetical protein
MEIYRQISPVTNEDIDSYVEALWKLKDLFILFPRKSQQLYAGFFLCQKPLN